MSDRRQDGAELDNRHGNPPLSPPSSTEHVELPPEHVKLPPPVPLSRWRFKRCSQCKGAGSLVVADLTEQLREQTGQAFTVTAPCPACSGSGGLLVEREPDED